MKLSLSQVVPSLEQKKLRAYVLYGGNAPLIQGVSQEINECFSHETIPAERLAQYRDDLAAPLLFGARPYLVHVEGVVSWPVVGPILSAWPMNHAVVLYASTIPLPWSRSSEIAAVGCYDCTLDESKTVVRRYLIRKKISLDAKSLEWCSAATQSGQWRGVMGVLELAAGSEKSIALGDIRHLFPEVSDGASLAILDPGKGHWDMGEIEDPIKILRSWQRIMLQVWQLKQLLQSKPLDQALESVRPMIFFKNKMPIGRAAETWSTGRIVRCLGRLVQTEVSLKKEPSIATTLLIRLLKNC
jgi:hypothetical protein